MIGERPGSRRGSLERPAGKPFGKPAGETPGKSPRNNPRKTPRNNPRNDPRLPPRRRQATARGLAAVYFHHRPIRNEKKHPSPLLVEPGCVNTEPTALAGRTAAPRSWGSDASTPRQRLAALPPPLLVGWVCVCIEPKHPVSQNAAGGKPLLVGLPPSTPTATPFGTKRRTPAPCSWGGRSSTSRQRHWPAALRPFVIFSSRHLPFSARFTMVYL